MGWRLGNACRPWLELPFLVLAAGVLHLGLLPLNVTEESIAGIAGSNNLYRFATNRDIWGAWWRDLFLALDSPELISFFERPVRFVALFGSLVVVLAWLFTLSDRFTEQRRLGFGWLAPLTLKCRRVHVAMQVHRVSTTRPRTTSTS